MFNEKIKISNLKVFSHVGVFEQEKKEGQFFVLNLEFEINDEFDLKNDNLKNTVNYCAVVEFVENFIEKSNFNLLETLAKELLKNLLLEFKLIKLAEIEIWKENLKEFKQKNHVFSKIAVYKKLKWHSAFLAIGSSLGNKEQFINFAIENLKQCDEIKLIKQSKTMQSKPYGNVAQNEFLNVVVEINSIKTPNELLNFCLEIEKKANRKREKKWADRTLDIDILFYENLIINETNLTIPHADLKNRIFFLKPMNEIAPNFVHPLNLKTIKELLKDLEK